MASRAANRADSTYIIRPATPADAPAIAHHRAAMFRDMGLIPGSEVERHEKAALAYLAPALPSGEYLGWVVEAAGTVVAGGGVLVRRLLPRPGFPEAGDEAYVLNVYTEPEHRRRGLARDLMHTILAWCRARTITRVSLHASDEGRGLYESLGFLPTNEMRLEGLR